LFCARYELFGGCASVEKLLKNDLTVSKVRLLKQKEDSTVGLQLRVGFVSAALLAMPRTALARQCVARDWTGHVAR
jgi:hypothetical protein